MDIRKLHKSQQEVHLGVETGERVAGRSGSCQEASGDVGEDTGFSVSAGGRPTPLSVSLAASSPLYYRP